MTCSDTFLPSKLQKTLLSLGRAALADGNEAGILGIPSPKSGRQSAKTRAPVFKQARAALNAKANRLLRLRRRSRFQGGKAAASAEKQQQKQTSPVFAVSASEQRQMAQNPALLCRSRVKQPKSLKKGLWGHNLEKIPSSLTKDMLDCGIRVLDIRDPKIKRAIRDKNFKSRGFLNMLKEIWSLKPDAEKLKKALILFKNWHGDKEDLALTVGYYLRATVSGMTEKFLKELDQFAVEKGVFPKGGYMTARELIKEEGRREGVQQGVQQGRQEGVQQGRQEGAQRMQAVVCNMLREKADISFISKVTGLPEAEIVKLKAGGQG